jgi:nitric oxide reductase NorE protein
MTLPEATNPAAASLDATKAARLPGDLAIWVFILAEMAAFAVFFAVYAFARARNVELFDAAQLTLDRRAGLINTLLLVTGGWFAASAVHAARGDRIAAAGRGLMLALACGAGFIVVKIGEYAEKFEAGISMSTNTFYLLYFSLTFFHFLHVILGMAILAILLFKLRQGAYGSHDVLGMETGTAYWHMVDLLWIVLFPLVYVMR